MKIFTMLFLTLVLGTIASVFLYQQWVISYQKSVLQPEFKHERKAAEATIQLFGLRKMQVATRHVLSSPRLLAGLRLADAKERHDKVHDELNALKSKKGLKSAAFLAATDADGMAFAKADSVNWKKDWSKLRPIKMSKEGHTANGLVMFQKKPYLFVTIPIIGTMAPAKPAPKKKDDDDDGDDDDDDTKKKKKKAGSAKSAGKCGAGRYYYCYYKCVKPKVLDKKTKKKKCPKWKKICFCRKGKKKTGSLQMSQTRTRLAQSAPDDRPEPGDRTPPPKAAPKPKTIGIIVAGFALGRGLAKELKKNTGLDVEFLSGSFQSYGGTLSGKLRTALQTKLKSKELTTDAKDVQSLMLSDTDAFVAMSTKLGDTKAATVVYMKSVSPSYGLFREYNITVFAILGLSFLLALILLLPGAGSFQKHLEATEEKVLETYNTGNLNVTFNESAPGVLGPFNATMNRLYGQLRHEPDDENQQPADAMDWNSFAQEGMPTSHLSDDLQPAATIQEEVGPAASPEGEVQPTTNEMIVHFLENPDAHYEEVFTQYRDAREKVGEDISKLKKDKFIEKLRKNAATYASQYECRGVLFEVTIKDDKVILKPNLIPKES